MAIRLSHRHVPLRCLMIIIAFFASHIPAYGVTWSFLGFDDSTVIDLDISPDSSNTVFALVSSDSVESLFKTDNGGNSWDYLSNAPSDLGGGASNLFQEVGINNRTSFVTLVDKNAAGQFIQDNVLRKGMPFYNVKHPDFGAICDGATDDSSAFTAAFAAAGTRGTVYIPPGNCRVSGVDVTTDMIGSKGSIITQSSASKDVFTVSPFVVVRNLTMNLLPTTTKAAFVVQTSGDHNQHARFYNIVITGQSGHTGLGFKVYTPDTYGIDDLLIDGLYARYLESAVQFDTTGGGWINGNSFKNIWVDAVTYGVDFNGANANGNSFDSVRGQYEASDPMIALINGVSGSSNTFVGCKRWDGGKLFDTVDSSYGNLFISPDALLADPNNVISDQGAENTFIFPLSREAIYTFTDSFVGGAISNIWNTTTTGTGDVDLAESLNYGGILLQTGTTSGSTAQLDFKGKATYSGNHKARVIFSTFTGGSAYNVKVEFGLQKAGDVDNRIAFRYDSSVGSNWLAVTADGSGTETVVDTGFSSYAFGVTFQITKIGTDKVLFFANGIKIGESTTNIFSSHWEPFAYIENSAAENKTLQIKIVDIRVF